MTERLRTGEKRAGKGGVVPPEKDRFQPGESGNPGGRPRMKPLSDAYRRVLGMSDEEIQKLNPAELSRAMKIALSIAKKAAEGDTRAAAEVADRVEGTAIRSVDVSGSLSTGHSAETVEAILEQWRRKNATPDKR